MLGGSEDFVSKSAHDPTTLIKAPTGREDAEEGVLRTRPVDVFDLEAEAMANKNIKNNMRTFPQSEVFGGPECILPSSMSGK